MSLQETFYFILLCSSVLCCNPDWFPYGTKCYRGIQFDYDVRLARRYCQIFRGDLAVISDNSKLQSIAPILFENSNEVSYWIHENSTLSSPASSSYCSYIYSDETLSVKLGTDGNCDNGKQFVCEVSKIDSDYICPTSWTYYGSMCYKTFKNAATYDQATSFCSLQRSQLAVLDDIAKEHNAAAVIIGQKDAFLVAAKKEGTNESEAFKWTSGKNFQPSCHECISQNGSGGDCMGFSSDEQHPTMFSWVPLNCSSSNYYMCEMQPKVPKSTTLTSTETTTTLAPLHCPVGYNWKAHEESGFCYWETTYETERLNWFQARKFCQAYGGDLATYDDAAHEEHGLGLAKGHYRGLWFGLERGKDDILRWVDNVTRSYSNWYTGEPNYGSPTKFCAKHGDKNSKWELDYCGVKRWFICKSPKTREPKLPDLEGITQRTKCNFSGPSVYRNQWYLYEDHCYLIRDEPKYSWNTAQYFCQDNGGHLASFHSFEETNFVLQTFSSGINTDLWIGLSARGLDSSFTWSDGTPLEFLYWEDNFNYTNGIDKCVTFDKQRGSWKTEHCNKFLGAICKRGLNASYDFATPEPTPLLPGNCEKGWYRLGNKCYKSFGGKWSKRGSWDEAKKECEAKDATLASIHSSDEQNFLTDIMLNVGTSMWIGLENMDKGTLFKWSDDSLLDFTEWNANEPMISAEDTEYPKSFQGFTESSRRLCVELDYNVNNMGKWNDIPCYRQMPYVCQKSINPLLTEPSEDPFICPNITGWNRLGSTCFGVFENEPLSWIDAQAKCRTYEANLVTFTSSAEGIFLKKKIKNQKGFFWIGTRETERNQYQSVKYKTNPFTNWLTGQPLRRSDFDNCVSMNNQSKWIVQDCKEKLPYICAWSSEEEEVKENPTVEEISPCPSSLWVRLGDHCYLVSLGLETWSKAMRLCYKAGGNLASFHSLKELSLVMNHLKEKSSSLKYYFIGLGKQNDGSYAWVDHSPVDFTNWPLESSSVTRYSYGAVNECVGMNSITGIWENMGCDEFEYRYICKDSKKDNVRKSELLNTTQALNREAMKSARKDGDLSSGLSTGGIVGIVISVLLVLSVIGAVVYYFYRSRSVRPTLLEPDNL